MYSFASHGYGSDRIFLSISGLVKKYTEHCFCNPSKNWGFKKQRPKCPSSYSCTLWKLGKNFKRKSDSNSHKKFQQLWEFAMIRFSVLWAYKAKTSSEAICETVGSIMGQHCGKNRYLTPENFSKELVLRFNLGPLHLLNGLIHGLRTPREEIAFTARPKIHSHSQIFRYGQSIFCLPYPR